MSFFCFHDWVYIRKAKHIDEPYKHRAVYKGVVLNRSKWESDVLYYIREHSDLICSKCNKVKLKLDKELKKAKARNKKNDNIDKRRQGAISYGEKLLSLIDAQKN